MTIWYIRIDLFVFLLLFLMIEKLLKNVKKTLEFIVVTPIPTIPVMRFFFSSSSFFVWRGYKSFLNFVPLFVCFCFVFFNMNPFLWANLILSFYSNTCSNNLFHSFFIKGNGWKLIINHKAFRPQKCPVAWWAILLYFCSFSPRKKFRNLETMRFKIHPKRGVSSESGLANWSSHKGCNFGRVQFSHAKTQSRTISHWLNARVGNI